MIGLRVLAVLTLVLGACGGASAAPGKKKPRPEGTGKVVVKVIGFRNDDGQVLVALFGDEKGFPNKVEHALRKVARPLDKRASARSTRVRSPAGQSPAGPPTRQVKIVFDKVPAGEFAIAVHHDENKDFKMNTGAFGIPEEGYGASRDARGSFGPPSFKDAVLTLAPNETKVITIRVVY